MICADRTGEPSARGRNVPPTLEDAWSERLASAGSSHVMSATQERIRQPGGESVGLSPRPPRTGELVGGQIRCNEQPRSSGGRGSPGRVTWNGGGRTAGGWSSTAGAT